MSEALIRRGMSLEALIRRGMSLHRLKDSEDFAPLREQMSEEMAYLESVVMHWDGQSQDGVHGLLRAKHRLNALRDLKDWIDDEINAAVSAKLKRDSISRQSQKDPQDAQMTTPNGQSEA